MEGLWEALKIQIVAWGKTATSHGGGKGQEHTTEAQLSDAFLFDP